LPFSARNYSMTARTVTQWISDQAQALGFELCGVVSAHEFPELQHFEDWIHRGFHGEMKYLEDPRRRNPSQVLEPLRSIIVCGLNYNTAHPYSVDAAAASQQNEPRGWISRYAWGDDYHELMWSKLNALQASLKEKFTEPFASRAYADTGPLAERVLAKYAGLGWLGKNTLLINEKRGSWFFLGVILTSLELPPALASLDIAPPDLCGNCRQCLDACPTGALVEPYMMDARRCISYLTIELRGNLPEEFLPQMGWQVYGCDICQDVCPFNRNAPVTALREFEPRPRNSSQSLYLPDLQWLAGLTEQEFRTFFKASAMKRAKWQGLVRNACIALGNSGLRRTEPKHREAIAALEGLAESPNNVISVSAQWALSRIL
jgi:epoxyqueuosine reductase